MYKKVVAILFLLLTINSSFTQAPITYISFIEQEKKKIEEFKNKNWNLDLNNRELVIFQKDREEIKMLVMDGEVSIAEKYVKIVNEYEESWDGKEYKKDFKELMWEAFETQELVTGLGLFLTGKSYSDHTVEVCRTIIDNHQIYSKYGREVFLKFIKGYSLFETAWVTARSGTQFFFVYEDDMPISNYELEEKYESTRNLIYRTVNKALTDNCQKLDIVYNNKIFNLI